MQKCLPLLSLLSPILSCLPLLPNEKHTTLSPKSKSLAMSMILSSIWTLITSLPVLNSSKLSAFSWTERSMNMNNRPYSLMRPLPNPTSALSVHRSSRGTPFPTPVLIQKKSVTTSESSAVSSTALLVPARLPPTSSTTTSSWTPAATASSPRSL